MPVKIGEEKALSETNLSKLNTVLLVVVIVLLLWNSFWKPQPQTSGRFQRLDTPRMALDTKTGRLCATVGPVSENLPLCSDLK